MNNETLRVVAYSHETHEAPFLRFIEKVLGVERREQRSKIVDAIENRMPGRDRLPLRHIIIDGDRVAGSLGHLPADFLIRGKPVSARFTHDLLVDPDYRGRGLAKLIVGHARELGDFFPGGMWMTDPCYKIHLASGFDDAKPLTTHTLALDPDAFAVRKQLSTIKRVISKIGLSVTRGRALKRSRRNVAKDDIAITSTDRFDPVLDSDWLRLAEGYGVTRIRNAAYLNWKYAHHPTLAYRSIVATGGDRHTGYLIWRLPPKNAEEKRAIIADFLVNKGDVETLARMLSRVIVDAAEAGMETLSVLSTQDWAINLFRSFGFFPRAARSTWVVSGWQDYMPTSWLTDHSPWHVCLGDSDGDIWTGSQ